MRVRVLLTLTVLLGLTGVPTYAQDVPVFTVAPQVVPLGTSVVAVGEGFVPGTVRIFLDTTTAVPVGELDHSGAFTFSVEIAGIKEGAHLVIACNNQSRTGACRQEASQSIRVVAPTVATTTTTTTPSRVTTTTAPRATTTAPRVTTTAPRATTTAPRATTTVPRVTTTQPGVATLPTTTAPNGGVVAGTTTVPTSTTPGNIVASIPIGPDPTFDPTPGDIAIATTTEPPQFAAPTNTDSYPDTRLVAIEVTQGIQDLTSRMPLVADRTTWVRVHVDSAGDQAWAPIDGALLLQRAGRPDLVMVPENGPIATKRPRTDVDSTLNFEIPDGFLGDGSLSLTAVVWSFSASSLDTVEPVPDNNLMQLDVEFHTADVPTIWLAALDDGTGPGPVVENLLGLLSAAVIVHQDMLDYHPTAAVNYEAYPAIVEPGTEALVPGEWKLGWLAGEDPDAEDNDDADTPRRTEPNVRLAWLTSDLPEEANVLGIFDSSIPADGYTGWAKHGVSWTKPSAGTPAHELGHNRGLKHVACKDADFDGIPDEIKGGAIDPAHPTGLPPDCSLAPTSPSGYFGLTTERDSLTVYSNDPTDAAAAFPFMGYESPGWTDPYHWCLLLDYVSVPCAPGGIGVPPRNLQPAADCTPQPAGGFGMELCLIDQLPAPADPSGGGTGSANQFGGPVPYAQQQICEGASVSYLLRIDGVDGPPEATAGTTCTQHASGDGTTDQFFTIDITAGEPAPGTIIAPNEPAAWMLVSGYVDLANGHVELQQAALRDTIPPSLRHRYEQHVVGVASGASPMQYSVGIVDDDGGIVSRIPIDLDGAGHGDGGEHGRLVSFFQAVPAAACCFVQIDDAQGVVAQWAISPNAPIVEDVVVTDTEDATRVEWTASDTDGEPLTFDVLWSADGESWLPAATGVTDTSVEVPNDAWFPGGDGVVVRVVANDGTRTGGAVSAPFSAPGHVPLLVVSGIPDSGTVEQYDTVLFQAHAVDPDDDGTDADSVRWTSDLAGDLGTGVILRTRDLIVGRHTIEVQATDSDGNTVVEQFTIEVAPRTSPTRYLEMPDPDAVAMLTGAAVVDDRSTEADGEAIDGESDVGAPADEAASGPQPGAPTGGGRSSLALAIGVAGGLVVVGGAVAAARRRRAA